jgi:hypothetical protein
MRIVIAFFVMGSLVPAQTPQLRFLERKQPILDAHNCYPYEGQWSDRVDRALKIDYPVGIEQDLAWYVDPSTGKGRIVVTHTAKTTGAEPLLRDYFFERVRPIIEKELARGDRSRWPVILVHFDFKDNQAPLLHAVWDLLGEYQSWITTAVKGSDPSKLAPFEMKPLMVWTEDSDAQEEVFFHQVPVGTKLRLFGSAHTNAQPGSTREERNHLVATVVPDKLLSEHPTNYRRWWNNSWFEVEEGGQHAAGEWTTADDRRLRALVDHAHDLGYWIRFYTLDGFAPGEDRGWGDGYNFGSRAAVELRWKAALAAGVDLIATDQYEDFAPFVKLHTPK